MDPEARPSVPFVYFSYTQQTGKVMVAMADVLRDRGCDATMAPIFFIDPRYEKRFKQFPMPHPYLEVSGMIAAELRHRAAEIGIPDVVTAKRCEFVCIGSPTRWLSTKVPIRSFPESSEGLEAARRNTVRRRIGRADGPFSAAGVAGPARAALRTAAQPAIRSDVPPTPEEHPWLRQSAGAPLRTRGGDQPHTNHRHHPRALVQPGRRQQWCLRRRMVHSTIKSFGGNYMYVLGSILFAAMAIVLVFAFYRKWRQSND